MQKTFYTIMVFNEILEKPISIRIPKSAIKYSLFVFPLFIFAMVSFSIYFIHHYSIALKEAGEVNKLRIENKSQKLQIEKFVNKVTDFEKQIGRMETLDKKLRVVTDTGNREKAKSYKIGVGGSPEINNANIPLTPKRIEKLIMKVDSLKAQADLQEISFVELDRYFKDRQSFLASIPSIWPVKGWVTSGFGYRVSPYTGAREIHDGVDIAAPLHSYVIAPADGLVVRSGRKRSLGLMMEIDHGYGLLTRYGHNSKNLVKVGDRVKRGQVIAQIGRTGRSTGPHLHYGIFLNGIPVNPAKYIIEQ